jgi:hypothetical protein
LLFFSSPEKSGSKAKKPKKVYTPYDEKRAVHIRRSFPTIAPYLFVDSSSLTISQRLPLVEPTCRI